MKITPAQILVITKDSKLEYDCRQEGLTHAQMRQRYRQAGVDTERIMASHEVQIAHRKQLKTVIPEQQIVTRARFEPELLLGHKVIISLGGDNHMQFVARYLKNQMLLGINSDPTRSDGCLTQGTADNLDQHIAAITSGNYRTQNWTRFSVRLNRHKLPFPVLCNVFLGEHHREDMSRHELDWKNKKTVQKSSGLLVYTGTGSTAWKATPDQKAFSRQSPHLEYALTEPYTGRISKTARTRGRFRPTECFRITSLNDHRGVIIADALNIYPFPMGSRVRIEPGQPLQILQPNLN